MTDRLRELYYGPGQPTAFASKQRLVSAYGGRAKSKEVEHWLRGEDAYTLHKPVRKRFRRNVVYSDNIDDCFQADLADLTSLQADNSGFKYLLGVICVFSKFAWVEKLKSKSGSEVARAFNTIFDKSSRIPLRIVTDKGKEFQNATVQAVFRKRDIQHFVAHNPDTKASVIEILAYFAGETLQIHDIRQHAALYRRV